MTPLWQGEEVSEMEFAVKAFTALVEETYNDELHELARERAVVDATEKVLGEANRARLAGLTLRVKAIESFLINMNEKAKDFDIPCDIIDTGGETYDGV